jgi:hypothetical protein
MDHGGGWQGGFPIQPNTFGHPFGDTQNHDDWEEWLRWDPTADVGSSPEDDTFNSGSSKNDSPIQDTVLPADIELFGKGNDTLAPPLVVGEDTFGLDMDGASTNEPFLFGGALDDTAAFDFQPTMALEQPHVNMPRLDTNAAGWNMEPNTDNQSVDLSALTAETLNGLPSAATVSSTAPSMHFSPESTSHVQTSISSNSPEVVPAPKKRGRKRKADIEAERLALLEQNGNNSQEDGDEPPMKKTSHNVIEKRYRNNLNDKIVELRNSVPSLRAMGRANRGDDTEDLEGLTPAHKLNKATVMGKATEYIRHLEKRNKSLSDEMETLKARLAAVEAAIGKSRDRQASISGSPQSTSSRPRQTSASSQNGAGFLNVPQEQMGFGQQVVQQQYMQPQTQPGYHRQPNPPVEAQNQPQYVNARGRGGLMNKVMIGGMAGIMMMDGFQQQFSDDGSSPNGLAAVPVPHLFKRGDSSPTSIAAASRQAALPLLKMFLVLGALVYLIAPLLTFSPRRKQRIRATGVRLPHAPSLASPIEVRRKAWLTAIQTVWVPKHFLLEVVAVTCKMISLSVRRLVGSEAFNSLTGANKEDETARIKAWDIAIDAQLAGGDQEVSYYRLLLTLMESGTLPDSSTRLMQKAVHFRVFFWEVANAGYGNMIGFKQFTERVGRFYWDTARRQQKELVHAKAQGRPTEESDDEVELLPDHLASLLDLECDDVLSDEMIQRAWNLAWNKPSAYRTVANAARDAVVEDHAIRSPLDAVAAWYANMTVDDTLADSLTPHSSSIDTEYYIGLAVSIAPPASATLARALAAKAVLSSSNRNTNVLAALEALPAVVPASGEMNVVSHIPATPDVRVALTLGKLLALTAASATTTAQARALDALEGLHLPPASFTLLTAVGTHRLLNHLTNSKLTLSHNVKASLEDLAANLRVWVGTSAGRAAGMGKEECALMVDLCLSVAKKVGGWAEERDSGYGSASASSSAIPSAESSPVRHFAELRATAV